MSKVSSARKMVLGLGNTLNRDEGLGVHALKALEARLLPRLHSSSQWKVMNENLEFLDGGVLGLNLLPFVEEASHLLVLDAINAGKEPGTVVELKCDEIPLFTGIKLSDHQVTFQEVLALASFRDKLPEHLHLVGIQPMDISIGVDLSPAIQAALPQVLSRAESVLKKWGLLDSFVKPNEQKIQLLERQIADLKARWPAHSVPPQMMQQLDELETELENERYARPPQ
jgi:hydrogenase maturation protease